MKREGIADGANKRRDDLSEEPDASQSARPDLRGRRPARAVPTATGTTTLVKFDCLLLRYNDAAPVSICRVARKGRSRNSMDKPYQVIITINNQTKCHSVATVLSETMLLVSRRESSGHCSWLI